jgi:hypothetical protein
MELAATIPSHGVMALIDAAGLQVKAIVMGPIPRWVELYVCLRRAVFGRWVTVLGVSAVRYCLVLHCMVQGWYLTGPR